MIPTRKKDQAAGVKRGRRQEQQHHAGAVIKTLSPRHRPCESGEMILGVGAKAPRGPRNRQRGNANRGKMSMGRLGEMGKLWEVCEPQLAERSYATTQKRCLNLVIWSLRLLIHERFIILGSVSWERRAAQLFAQAGGSDRG